MPSALPLLCSVPVFRAFMQQSGLTHAYLGLCAGKGVSRWLRAAGRAGAEHGLATCAEAAEAANRAEAGRAVVGLLWLERAHAGSWSMDDSSSCTAYLGRVRLIWCWLCSAVLLSHTSTRAEMSSVLCHGRCPFVDISVLLLLLRLLGASLPPAAQTKATTNMNRFEDGWRSGRRVRREQPSNHRFWREAVVFRWLDQPSRQVNSQDTINVKVSRPGHSQRTRGDSRPKNPGHSSTACQLSAGADRCATIFKLPACRMLALRLLPKSLLLLRAASRVPNWMARFSRPAACVSPREASRWRRMRLSPTPACPSTSTGTHIRCQTNPTPSRAITQLVYAPASAH